MTNELVAVSPEDLRFVVNSVLSDKLVFTLPQLLLVVLVSGISVYLGALLKKTGENQAILNTINELTEKVEAIKARYSKEAEEYKAELGRRRDALETADVLAEFFYGKQSDPELFMAKVWRLSLTLPPNVVFQLAETLVKAKKGEKNPKQLLIEIRKAIHGPDDPVTAESLTHIES